MKQIAILFITLFFIALSPAFSQEKGAQTTVNSEQGTVPAVNSEQGAVPAPVGQPAAVEQKAPAPVAQPAAVDKKAPEPKKASAAPPEDKLPWWPTDAQPAPVKDAQRGGFWWWPRSPGTVKDLWGNRGYAYVNKIIYDWHGGGTGGTGGIGGTGGTTGGTGGTSGTGGTGGTGGIGGTGGTTGGTGGALKDVQVKINDIGFPETEKKPSLLVKRTIRSEQLQFKDNNVEIKPEHASLLKKAAASLKRDKEANVLITASNDTPELGSARTHLVEKFLMDQGVAQERIYILAPEKFQEAGLSSKEQPKPGTIQVLIAEVKEVMIPGPKN
jgi:outer membrane protein OmpA-like peptidoglycan-associated protein